MARGYMYASGASDEVDYAKRDDLTKAQVIALGQSKNDYVREIIAARSDCPLGIMITLTHDRSPDVRAAVAANVNASRTVMEHLSRDKHLPVLQALINNTSIPQDILEQLAFHRSSEVRTMVARRLDAGAYAPATMPVALPMELQDKVPGATVVPFPSGTVSLAQDVATARPTRTAPVRGFSAPEAI